MRAPIPQGSPMTTSAAPLTVVICADHASITGGQAKVAIDSALGLHRGGVRTIFFAAAAPVDQRLYDAGVEVVCLGQTDLLGAASRATAICAGTSRSSTMITPSAGRSTASRLGSVTKPSNGIGHWSR